MRRMGVIRQRTRRRVSVGKEGVSNVRATRRATAAQRASYLGERGPEALRARLEVMGYVEPLPDVRRICSLPGVARHVGVGVNAYLVRCLTLVAHGHAPGAVRWWQPPGDLRSAEVGRMGHVVSPCARVVETAVGGASRGLSLAVSRVGRESSTVLQRARELVSVSRETSSRVVWSERRAE